MAKINFTRLIVNPNLKGLIKNRDRKKHGIAIRPTLALSMIGIIAMAAQIK
jgi:hypothetical protein